MCVWGANSMHQLCKIQNVRLSSVKILCLLIWPGDRMDPKFQPGTTLKNELNGALRKKVTFAFHETEKQNFCRGKLRIYSKQVLKFSVL